MPPGDSGQVHPFCQPGLEFLYPARGQWHGVPGFEGALLATGRDPADPLGSAVSSAPVANDEQRCAPTHGRKAMPAVSTSGGPAHL